MKNNNLSLPFHIVSSIKKIKNKNVYNGNFFQLDLLIYCVDWTQPFNIFSIFLMVFTFFVSDFSIFFKLVVHFEEDFHVEVFSAVGCCVISHGLFRELNCCFRLCEICYFLYCINEINNNLCITIVFDIIIIGTQVSYYFIFIFILNYYYYLILLCKIYSSFMHVSFEICTSSCLFLLFTLMQKRTIGRSFQLKFARDIFRSRSLADNFLLTPFTRGKNGDSRGKNLIEIIQ